MEGQGRKQMLGVENQGVVDQSGVMRLDDARWDAIVTSLPPLVRARAMNGERTRASQTMTSVIPQPVFGAGNVRQATPSAPTRRRQPPANAYRVTLVRHRR